MNSLTLPTIPTKITKSEFGGYDCEPSSWFVGEPKPVPGYDGLFSHSVCYQKGDYYFTVASNITYEKDARLIATAPELLSACEGMLASFHESVTTEESLAQFPALAAVARAIAKATGRAA